MAEPSYNELKGLISDSSLVPNCCDSIVQVVKDSDAEEDIASKGCVLSFKSVRSCLLARLYVHNKLITVVVDTGASHSCVSASFVAGLPKLAQSRMKPAGDFQALGADGKSLNCVGTVALALQLPNNEHWCKVHSWHVLQDLPYDALVGLDFLVAAKGVVHLPHGRLEFGETEFHQSAFVPIWWYGDQEEGLTTDGNILVVAQALELPAYTSNMAVCKVVLSSNMDLERLASTTGVVEPLSRDKESPYHVAHSVAHLESTSFGTPNEGHGIGMHGVGCNSEVRCKVWLTNTSATDLSLGVGTSVARFVPLQVGETVTLLATPSPRGGQAELTSSGVDTLGRTTDQGGVVDLTSPGTVAFMDAAVEAGKDMCFNDREHFLAKGRRDHVPAGNRDGPGPSVHPSRRVVRFQVPQPTVPKGQKEGRDPALQHYGETSPEGSDPLPQPKSSRRKPIVGKPAKGGLAPAKRQTRGDTADAEGQPSDSEILPPGVADPDTFQYPGIPLSERANFSRRVRRLLAKYNHVFSQKEGDYGLCTVDELSLTLTTQVPVYRRPYNMPHHLRDPVQQQLNMLDEADVIEHARSPYSAPLVLVAKKDGGVRICVDYRFLNAITKRDGYPLPRIDMCLDMLRGAKVFSVFDLYGGFHQFSVNPQDREKLAFTTPWGQYQFKRAPMGIANMPSLFSRAMNTIFADMLFVHLLVYIDDLMCYSANSEDHLVHLEALFERLSDAGLKLSGKKSQLFTDRVQYLGHVVGPDGVSPDPGKIAAIKEKAYPTNIKELRSDLCLFSYYRGFVPYFSDKAQPLAKLLGESPQDKALKKKLARPAISKDKKAPSKQSAAEKRARQHALNAKFVWGAEQQEAYDELRLALIQAPTLAHPDFTRPFVVDTDASQVALGAVCSQVNDEGEEHPVAYASRTLTSSERNYATTKREGLGIYWAVCKAFRQYTYGAPFVLRTDHSALTSIFGLGDAPEPIIAGWQMALSSYTYDISHRAGTDHGNADGLSRPSQQSMEPADEDPDLTYPAFIGGIFEDHSPVFPVLLVAAKGRKRKEGKESRRLKAQTGIIGPGAGAKLGSKEMETSTQLWAHAVMSQGGALTQDQVREAQQADLLISSVRDYLLGKSEEYTDHEVVLEASRCTMAHDLIYIWILEHRTTRKPSRVPRVWLPKSLQQQALASCHDAPQGGHYDTARSFHRLTSVYWWPGMWHDTEEWVKSCAPCQHRKTPRMQARLPVREGMEPTYPFQYVAMDITELIGSDNQLTHVLVFIDLFTRWVEVVPFDTSPTAEEVAKALYLQVVARHGAPEYLVTDNGSNMSAQLIRDVCVALATRHVATSPYCPQTNGVVERFNRTFKNLLALVAHDKPSDWLAFVPAVLFAYRTAWHAALGDSPFFLLYGRDPREPLDYLTEKVGSLATVAYRQQLLDRVQYARQAVQTVMHTQAKRHRDTANRSVREIPTLADLVLRKKQLIRNEHTSQGVVPGKLLPQWEGPFRVLRQVAPLSYDIQRVGTTEVERAHARHLKLYFPRAGDSLERPIRDLHPTAAESVDEGVYEVHKIVSHQWDALSKQPLFRVRWQGYLAADDTWETLAVLQATASAVLTDYLASLLHSGSA